MIYPQEQGLNLFEPIKYSAQLAPLNNKYYEEIYNELPEVLRARAKVSDLYYTESIFVTTNWNRNTDVFDPYEVWAAKDTPINKPTNVEHDEHKIVGHITHTWATALDGTIIENEINLPARYHLCNSAVIYKIWEDEEILGRAEKLIAEIEEGKKFVSMECIFDNFDYVLKSSAGYEIKKRTKETANITRCLRQYGGSGEWEGYQVGRLLRNITFSGKGYVDKPANPDSIILSSRASTNVTIPLEVFKEKTQSRENGVISNCNINTKNGDNQMSDILQQRLEKAEAQLAKANEDNVKLREEMAKSGIDTIKTQLEAAQKKIDELVAEAKEKEDKMKEDEKAAKEKASASESKIEELTKANKELQDKVDAAEAEKITAHRVSTLVDGGIDKAEAEETVATFADLNDNQFKVVSDKLIAAYMKEKEAKEDKKKKEKDSEDEDESDSGSANADTDPSDVEDTESANANVSDSEDDDDDEDDFDLLSKAAASMLSLNNNGDK